MGRNVLTRTSVAGSYPSDLSQDKGPNDINGGVIGGEIMFVREHTEAGDLGNGGRDLINGKTVDIKNKNTHRKRHTNAP